MKVSQALRFALFMSSSFAFTNAAHAQFFSNCEDVKNSLKNEWAVVASDFCTYRTPSDAEWDVVGLCISVGVQGGLAVDKGAREVANWFVAPLVGKRPLPNTYLGYCAGDRLPSGAAPIDEGKGKELQKQIQDHLSTMKK